MNLRWAGVGVLLLLALMVVFVLPEVVDRYELPLERRLEPRIAAVPDDSGGSGVAPFAEAQLGRQRKAAQDVLARLLQAQAELEPLAVESWGQADYEAALQAAAVGDGHYRAQDYPEAEAAYSRGEGIMTGLRDSVPAVLARLLDEGRAALTAGEAATAEARFTLALLLAPALKEEEAAAEDEDEDHIEATEVVIAITASGRAPALSQATATDVANKGLARAKVLDQVRALQSQAEDQVLDDDLSGAERTLQAARALDPADTVVQARLAAVRRLLIDAEFSRTMSQGFALLSAADPAAAIDTFRQAAALDISTEQAAQAAAAIEQTETDLETARINRLRDDIRTAEAEEAWQDAVAAYDAVLVLDPNLSFAIEGRRDAAQMARLHSLLDRAIAEPLRLADDGVYQQALDAYYSGRAVVSASPGQRRLAGQLDRLQTLLEEARQPVEVPIASDGLTAVTLRPGMVELGGFQQRNVALLPGDYVAVGSRNGYRDVRVPFRVGFGEHPGQVFVQCTEPVAGARL